MKHSLGIWQKLAIDPLEELCIWNFHFGLQLIKAEIVALWAEHSIKYASSYTGLKKENSTWITYLVKYDNKIINNDVPTTLSL